MEEQNKVELTSGLTSDMMSAIFFRENALREPAYRLYRLDGNGYRYYYRFNESGDVEFYPSVTTMLGQVMPTSPYLIEWMLDNGKEQANEKRDLAAAYGTFMHGEFEKLAINRTYDFNATAGALMDYLERENLPAEKVFSEWADKIQKDVLSFAQFMIDWKVIPLAVEISLVHPEHKYAGCLDLICKMTDPRTEEEFSAIVDFKSGRKGFWESHEIQLHLYKMMAEVNFEIEVQRVFNFAPKDWRKKPTYNLKDQTEAQSRLKIPHLLELARIADEERDSSVIVVRGSIDLDNASSVEESYKTLSLSELIKERAAEETPETAENAPNSETSDEGGENVKAEEESPEKTAVSAEPENDLPWEVETKKETTGNPIADLFNDMDF